MIEITLINDKVFKGKTFREIARKIKMNDSSLPENVKEYMEGVDTRFDLAGVDLDTRKPKKFFKSMEKAGFCEIKEE